MGDNRPAGFLRRRVHGTAFVVSAASHETITAAAAAGYNNARSRTMGFEVRAEVAHKSSERHIAVVAEGG